MLLSPMTIETTPVTACSSWNRSRGRCSASTPDWLLSLRDGRAPLRILEDGEVGEDVQHRRLTDCCRSKMDASYRILEDGESEQLVGGVARHAVVRAPSLIQLPLG